jgi:hypothetical protein
MPLCWLKTTTLKEEMLKREEIDFDFIPRSFFSSLFLHRFGYRISMTCRTEDDSNGRILSQRQRSWRIHSETLDETSERVGNKRHGRWIIERRKEREYLFGGFNSYCHAIKEE